MRTRRGSVTVEALMVLPIAVLMILLGRMLLEASLNRQETAVFARGSAVSEATTGAFSFGSCDFERDAFAGRPSVEQQPNVRCSRRDAESGLSAERPMWDEIEEGAAPWDEILRDVRPRRMPRDVVASAEVSMRLTGPAFFTRQSPTRGAQRYITPDRGMLWTHGEDDLAEGHDRVIWDELCGGASWRLFPNVFPSAGSDRC